MPKPYRKILLTTPYDLAVEGGVNTQLWGLYRALKEKPGYRVRVVGPSSRPDSHGCSDLTVAGRVVSWRFNRAVSNVTPDISIFAKIKRLVRAFQPHLIHLQEPLLPVLNTMVLYHSRCANVGTYHTYSETSRGYDIARPILKWHHDRVHFHIAVSDAARRFVAKTFPGRYTIIPNGIDLPAASKDGKGAGISADGKTNLLFVGRWNEARKGFSVLADAVNLLEKKYPGRFHLTVAGDGRDDGVQPVIEGAVTWIGRLSAKELNAAYADCDLVCAPSLGGESFGLVVLEAFAHGKPVVASGIDGYREMAGRCGAAVFVDPGSVRSLAEGIETVASADVDAYNAMAAAARRHADQFAWPGVADRIVACYDTVLRRQNARNATGGIQR